MPSSIPFPILGKPGSLSRETPERRIIPALAWFQWRRFWHGFKFVNLGQLCSAGFPVGFRVTAFSPMLAAIGCQLNHSGGCCHSRIREGWNFTITKTKLSRLHADSSLCFNLASCPQAVACLGWTNHTPAAEPPRNLGWWGSWALYQQAPRDSLCSRKARR